jgi:two-component system CheB/CheR fusion protein
MAGKSPPNLTTSKSQLAAENEELRLRLDEAEQAIEAIRTGQAESLVVEGPNGPRVFSLEGADHSYRVLVEAMNEGAATLGENGTILYCNVRLAELLGSPIERVMGSAFRRFLPDSSRDTFEALVREAQGSEDQGSEGRGELELLGHDDEIVPAHLSMSVIRDGGSSRLCVVVADLRARKRNEEIVAAEQLARSVLEQAAEAIFVCDESGRIIRASASAAELCTGNPLLRPFEEALPLVLPTRSPSTSRGSLVVQALCGKVLRAVPASLIRKNGLRAEVLVSAKSLVASDGRTIGCVVNVIDVTERRRAEEAERRYGKLLNASPDAIFVWRFDRGVETWNPGAKRLYGFSAAEACGQNPHELLKSEAAQPWAEVEAAIHQYGSWEGDLVQRTKDGHTISVSARLQVAVGDDGIARVLESNRDITERNRTEAELRRQAAALAAAQKITEDDKQRLEVMLASREKVARLYAVLSRVNEAIVRCRVEQELHEQVCSILVELGGYPLAWIGQVRGERVVPTVACGPAADYVHEITVTVEGEFGKGPTGTSIREAHPVVNQDFLAEAVMSPWREHAMRRGFRSSAAFPLRRGETVVAALTLYASEPGAFDAEHTNLLDALVADLSYAQDAIEDERLRALAEESLARSEAQLRDADERKSQFLAMLSHELRNPLTPIKNSLHILHRVAPDSEQALRSKAVIERQVDQLARLVDDLLDVTRLARGKFRLERARLDLVDTVRRTAEDHKPLLTSAGIDFEVELPSQPLWIHGDAARLIQMVGNLVTNAAKFTPPNGKVTLSVEKSSAEFATLCVRDTGVGISKALLPLLFEPFMQAESTLDRTKGGLGLGLALVKGVVEMHGGTVEPRSDGPGCGAEFIVRLPTETGPHTPLADDEVAKVPQSSRRVLVIEDNVDAADSLRDVLALCGHEVEIACDGYAGVEKARAFRPEVILCDIGLPKMDGYQVAKALRADANLSRVRLVALSGYAQPEDLQCSLDAGFDAHLAKPATIETIERAVAGAVESRQPK